MRQRYTFAARLGISALMLMLLGGGFASTWFTTRLRAATGVADTSGTDFWFAFSQNYDPAQEATLPLSLTLFITSATSTTGTVSVPGLAISVPFAVTAGGVTTVPIDIAAQLTANDAVEGKGVHVTAADDVTVYGLNRRSTSTDAFLGLPTDILGQEYITLGYANSSFSNPGNQTQFAVVGTQAGTVVTITPSVTTGGHDGGTPFNVTLNVGETYQLMNAVANVDLTGTIITSTQPVAVFAGHTCGLVPQDYDACDFLVEQLQPTTTWGRRFATMPLATRVGGDTFRFLAQQDGTDVSVNGTVVATINRGQIFEQIIDGASEIVSSRPILVAQYSNGSNYDGVISDPFMVLVPPVEQFQAGYSVTTPASGFAANFINVVVPTTAVASVRLDGAALTPANIVAGAFAPISTSGYSGAQLIVGLGSHRVGADLPLGLIVYGFDAFDSYGYPGGMSLAPVAVVTNLALSPKTAENPLETQHCVTALVTDQFSAPVVGVRVDFEVEGSHDVLGFANTDADGKAVFCYTGTVPGEDTITATQGTLFDTAAKTWVEDATPVATTLELTPPTATHQVGAEHCVTATLTDQNDDPLAGEPIAFATSGVHALTGAGTTDANGEAVFCYVGSVPGTDAIVATHGDLSATVAAIWEAPPEPEPCVKDGDEYKKGDTWPVSSLYLGALKYPRNQLVFMLSKASSPASRGDGLLQLAAQLIAARLNIAAGAPAPSSVTAAIAAADWLIGKQAILPIGTSCLSPDAVASAVRTLSLYNNGQLRGGPKACKPGDVPKPGTGHDPDCQGQGQSQNKDKPGRPRRPAHAPKPSHAPKPPTHYPGDRCIPGLHGHTAGDNCHGKSGGHHQGDGCDPRDFRHKIGCR